MKLLKKQISEKDGAGFIVLRAEEPEDMWHVYNLIHVHDSVKTTTIRKVDYRYTVHNSILYSN
jgi:protein pelota